MRVEGRQGRGLDWGILLDGGIWRILGEAVGEFSFNRALWWNIFALRLWGQILCFGWDLVVFVWFGGFVTV